MQNQLEPLGSLTGKAVNWHNKKYGEAVDELEKYLKLHPKAPDAEKIRETIKELRHKS